MSILDTFDPHFEAIISPATLRPPVEGFPEVFIMTFKDKSLKILQEIAQTEVVVTTRAGWDIPHYKFRWNGRELGAFQTLMGGAGIAMLLEEAISMGAKKVLIYGSCGALDAGLVAGHFILPTQAYRDEGVSYHYMPASDYVDIPTAERLGEIFDELHLPYVKGRVWTTDAVFRETRSNMEKRKAEGCLAVEMECASAMAVGQFLGVEVYQFLYAADSLDGVAWAPRTLGKTEMSDYEKYLRVALEVASRL